ncbi:MAG: homocysteine S-methyltransferase family protein [Armatimonadota bacterium]
MHPIFQQPVMIFDGACGTNLQNMEIPSGAWQGCEGCNELLNVTAPEVIQSLHRSFVQAGAQLLETNSFGANSIVLAEYGLQDQVSQICQAAVQNAKAVAGDKSLVIGSMGPGTKLPSLGHISVQDLANAYRQQAEALLAAGADGLILETCQDLLQLKTALISCLDVLGSDAGNIPLFVSVTIEATGTMLVGSDIAAVATTVEPYPVFCLGLNCATGPRDMRSHLQWLSHNWEGRLSCIPNQGLPEVVNGLTRYPMNPTVYAQQMKEFVQELGVSVLGGCCGTTPEHIQELVKTVAGVAPGTREVAR